MYNCQNNGTSVNIVTQGMSNLTTEYMRNYLLDLQLDKNLAIIPTFVFLLSLFILGAIGNPLILMVYSRDKKKTATRFFIMSIAVADLLATLVTIPVTFYVNFRNRIINNVYVCKFYFFVNFTNGTMSALLLLAVAFVRYRKICHPLSWQVSTFHARAINLAIAIACLGFSIPHVTVHGRHEKKTEIPGLCIHLCYVDDDYIQTIWPKVVVGLFIMIFISASGIMCFLYARIGLQAYSHGSRRRNSKAQRKINTEEHRKAFIKEDEGSHVKSSGSMGELTNASIVWQENKMYENSRHCHSNEVGTKCLALVGKQIEDSSTWVNSEIFNHFPTFPTLRDSKLEEARKSEVNPRWRTTYMLLTITAIYVATNMTTLALMFVRAMAEDDVLSLEPVLASIYSIFFNMFLLNCAVNPIIYSLWNRNFRQECMNVFRKIRFDR